MMFFLQLINHNDLKIIMITLRKAVDAQIFRR